MRRLVSPIQNIRLSASPSTDSKLVAHGLVDAGRDGAQYPPSLGQTTKCVASGIYPAGSRMDDKPVGKSIDKIKIKSAVQMTFDRHEDRQGLREMDRPRHLETDREGP